MVHMNGLRLEESDFTATTTTVTLGSGAAAGDEVTITAFVTFETADAYTKSASDTRFVNATGDNMTGNLGIGTTSPNGALHVKGISDHGKIVVEHGGTSGSTNHNFISFHNHAGNTVAEIQSEENATNSSALLFKTGGTTTNMTVSHNGYVTMPNQPCFSAGGDFGWTDVGNSYGKVTPWRTNQTGQFNSGMWNNSTGRATAPVAGRYQFNLNIYVNNSGEYFHYGRLYLNGSAFAGTMLHLGDTSNDYPDETMGASFIVNMSANDYVEYYHVEDIYGYHSSFSGFLVG
jgi:hypothetical protein